MDDAFAADAEFATVWTTIAPLLPVDKTITHINGPALVVEKLKRLDDADVVAYIAPCNEPFWRKMVLACFDFTVSPNKVFNVGEGEREDEYDRQTGTGMLAEDLNWWKHLGIFFRPSQYGFLNRIQSGDATVATAWPASEDAFTLFHELAMMKQMFGDMEGEVTTFSDGEQPVYPVLLSKMDEAIVGRGFPLLQHCGFARHTWEWVNETVSAMWSGLDPTREPSTEPRDLETYCIFPQAEGDIVEEIKEVVLEWCSDWRHVRVNEDDEETRSPAFYIGKSKKSTRWLGFVGQRDH